MQADDRLSLLLLAAQHLRDKLTFAEPRISDSAIVQAQIDDNQVSVILTVLGHVGRNRLCASDTLF